MSPFWSEYQFDEIYIKDNQLTEYAIMPMNLERECCQYTEEYPLQQWELTDELQTIQGYSCQKATCHWRGRDYEAWFTSEIPIRRGPWKFGGLPGLIVKISDAKKEYNFELVRLERTPRPIMQWNFSRFPGTNAETSEENQRELGQSVDIRSGTRIQRPSIQSDGTDGAMRAEQCLH